MPIVPAHLRVEWDEYSVANQGWIEEDLQAQADFKYEEEEATSNQKLKSSKDSTTQGDRFRVLRLSRLISRTTLG